MRKYRFSKKIFWIIEGRRTSLVKWLQRPSQGGRQASSLCRNSQPWIAHGTRFVVLGYALEHSVRGHGCWVPEPHHPPRQHYQPPRRGAAIPSRPQLCAAHGGALRCRRLEDQAWRVVVSMSGARSSIQPVVPLAVQRLTSRSLWFAIRKALVLVGEFVFVCEHAFLQGTHPQLSQLDRSDIVEWQNLTINDSSKHQQYGGIRTQPLSSGWAEEELGYILL